MAREFKSCASVSDRTLRVAGGPERTCFSIRNSQNVEALLFIENNTMPEVVLGILEEAGYKIAQRGDMDNVQSHVANALYELGCAVESQKRITAEAEAQAKLEAEALELMNVRLRASGTMVLLTKETVDPVALEGWLAVARRARELNKEEK